MGELISFEAKSTIFALAFSKPIKEQKRREVTKADVVNEIANKTGIEKVEVQRVVETFFTVLKDSMSEGNDVFFRGFGSFIVKMRAKKVARNIAQNTSMIIEPHNVPVFKPSKTFVEQVKSNSKVSA